jgi:hypothetical protein
MGELVPASIFRKWQAVINNSKVVERITALRLERNILSLNRVTVEDHARFVEIEEDMRDADMYTTYLLDMNQAEPLESDSVASPPTTPRGVA